jgi:hypothetical protein
MSRPAASVVSSLSGFVANGRQAVHHVSSPPSKIPYGGFSPVRLQIGSPAATFAHTGLYATVVRLAQWPGSLPLCAGRHQAPRTRRSRGPWLASGFYCPAGSSLTMASSAPLGLSRPFLSVSAGSLPLGQDPEGPQFTPLVLLSVPPSLPVGPDGG